MNRWFSSEKIFFFNSQNADESGRSPPNPCPIIARQPFLPAPGYSPNFSFHHPSVQRARLGGLKTGIYNPCLASMRRNDMDNVAQLMSDAHRQTTSTLRADDFKRLKDTFSSCPRLYCVPSETFSDKRYRHCYADASDFERVEEEFRKHLHCRSPMVPPPPTAPRCPDVTDVHATSVPLTSPLFVRPCSVFPRRSLDDKMGMSKYGQKLLPYETIYALFNAVSPCGVLYVGNNVPASFSHSS